MTKLAPLIAIVDDDESVGRALRRLLKSAGYDVATYTSGDDFLCALDRMPPSCVLLDLHMPIADGFWVQKRLAELHSEAPVIILTGHDTAAARDATMQGGAAAFFTKPVDGQKLIDAIDRVLTERDAAKPPDS